MSYKQTFCVQLIVAVATATCVLGCSDQLDAEACGIGWKPFEKSCYKIHTLPVTWEESLAHCLSVNAHLVKVTSREEMGFIYFSFVKPLRSGSAWIGLNLQQGSFRWTDDTELKYKNWNIGEPNNFKGYEHCVEIFVNNGKWNDIPCWLKRPYVCEKGGLQIHPTQHMSAGIGNKDHALANNTFQEYYVADVTQCLKKCLDTDKCSSFNFEYSGTTPRKCELNNSTRAWARDRYLERLGFIYYD